VVESLEFSLQFLSNKLREGVMNSESQDIWQFGNFRLDTGKKILWHQDKTVAMPLKELEVLCVLVINRGELVTKDELLDRVWENSFVEESNLSRHIYLLRRTLKELGAADGLIENVPRRGYRFTGEVHAVEANEIVLERRTQTRTLIEIEDETRPSVAWHLRRRALLAYGAAVILLAGSAAFFGTASRRCASSARGCRRSCRGWRRRCWRPSARRPRDSP